MTKRILSVLICLVMVLSLMPMAAFATGEVATLTVTLANDKTVYTATPKNPQISSVTYGETTLTSDQYTVSYARDGGDTNDFTSAGVIRVTVILNNNPAVSASANYTIMKKDLTIVVDNKEKTYGEVDPTFTGSAPDLWAGDSVTYTREPGVNVGTYAITATASSNYNFKVIPGALTIKAKDVADPNVVLEYVSAEYKGSPLTPTVTVKDGDVEVPASEYTVSYADNDKVGKGKVTISDAGAGNYNITSKTVEFNITAGTTPPVDGEGGGTDTPGGNEEDNLPPTTNKIPLKISVNNQAITYGGDITSVYGKDYTHEGLTVGHTAQITLGLNGNQIVVSSAKVFAGSDEVTDQYAITYTPATLTVNKATISVTAKNASKELGAAEPTAFDYEATGFVGGDTKDTVLEGALTRQAGETKGSYQITQGTLKIKDAQQANYQLSFTPGTFTIGGTSLVITTSNQSITYGQAVKQGEYSTTGLTSGHKLTVELAPSITNVGTGTVKVKSAVVTDGTGKDVTADYAVTSVEGTLTINPKVVNTPKIVLDRASYGYTGKAVEPTVTAVYDGNTLIPASEYTVSYENNINQGSGTGIVRISDKTGGNYTVSGYTTFTIASNIKYNVVLGNGGCWYRGSYYGLGFRCDGPYSDFLGLAIDGQPVDRSYYMVSEGSTNVGLYPQLLNLLGNGTHYITFKYTSGSATGVFYVGSTAINAVMTGDDSNVGVLALVMCLGLLSSVSALVVLRKKNGAR